MKDEALKLALEALENWREFDPENFGEVDNKAITAIKQALAAPVQEPVAWESEMRSELAKLGFEGQCPESIGITIKRWFDAYAESLTAQPAPVQEPLTFAGLSITEIRLPKGMTLRFEGGVLIIEAAHGIKEVT